MTLVWPHMLWLAALVPALILLERLVARRRGGEAAGPANIRRGVTAGGKVRFGDKLGGGKPVAWRYWLALLLVVTALARPQWGRVDGGPSSEAPGEVLIALDLSRSMLASDVSPTRLERARAVATRLAEELPDRRVGLIGFAGAAYLLAPPSEDRAVLRAYLPAMAPEHIAEQGTSFADLLDVALASFSGAEQGRALVVLTDGEVEPSVWQNRMPAFLSRHIRIVAVGVGTPAGGGILGPGARPVLTNAGEPVLTRLNPTALAELTGATGGAYVELARAGGIVEVVRQASMKPAEMGGAEREAAPARPDQFVWFVVGAVLLLCWSAAVEFAARPRLRRRGRALAQGALAAALVLGLSPPQPSEAARRPILTETDLQGEPDPLEHMKEVIAAMVAKPRLGAADYWQVAEVAIRYGEIHRGHSHPLEEGVLRDGLAAVAAGAAIDPAAADWVAGKARLDRLLEPPPPVPPDPGPVDPANEPMDGQGEQPMAGEDARDPGDEEPPEDEKEPSAGEQGLQNVGGSQRDSYDEAEWRDPSLVQPLDQLQRIREQDLPGELFRQMQTAGPPKPREQSW
jgi:Ca-activated chloride channel family protein